MPTYLKYIFFFSFRIKVGSGAGSGFGFFFLAEPDLDPRKQNIDYTQVRYLELLSIKSLSLRTLLLQTCNRQNTILGIAQLFSMRTLTFLSVSGYFHAYFTFSGCVCLFSCILYHFCLCLFISMSTLPFLSVSVDFHDYFTFSVCACLFKKSELHSNILYLISSYFCSCLYVRMCAELMNMCVSNLRPSIYTL